MDTNVGQFIEDLDAGAFEQKIGKALSDVAAGVIEHGRGGKVAITFTVKQLGNSNQVMIDHLIGYLKPTKNGESSEKNLTKTPMHVNLDGELSLFPKNQHQLFNKKGEVEK